MSELKIIPALAKYKDEITVPMARVYGIVNSDTLPTFKEYLEAIIARKPKRFIFDMGSVTYMNSSGAGEMIRLSDNFEGFGGTFIITNPSLEILHLIRLLGLENLLPVLPDVKHAIHLFRKGNFKNATIAIINQKLQARMLAEKREEHFIPMKPLGNYTMLMVPGKDFFSRFLEKRLTGAEGKLKIVKNLAQARKNIQKSIPDMLIIDDAIEKNKDLLFDLKSDMRTNRTRVIKMLREGTEEDAKFEDGDVYIQEDETLREPFDYNELLALARREYVKYKKLKRIVRHSTRFEILSNSKAIEDVNSMLYRFIELSRLPEDQITTFHLAVKEAVDNAYRHGNQKDEKKIIKVAFRMDAKKIVVTIADEGEGFDYAYFLDAAKRLSPEESARERHEKDATGGLGIIMMKKSSDKLSYKEPGNAVTLVKNFTLEEE